MMKSNLDWDKFRIFYHVARAGSFTQAARDLHTVQPSLTRSIQTLESQLNLKLFIRTARGVQLTSQGQVLFKSVDKIYREFLQSELYMQDQQKETKSTLKIGLHKNLAYDHILKIILGFATKYPENKLKIIQTEDEAEILNYRIDVAILPSQIEREEEELTQDYLCSFYQHLYASSSYLKKFGIPQTKQDLSKHQFILFNEEASASISPGKIDQRKIIQTNYSCIDSCEGMRQAAEAGHGIAALMIDPKDLKDSSLVKVLAELGTQEIPFYLTYPSYLKSSQRILQFSNYLKKILREKGEYIYNRSVAQTSESIYQMQEDCFLDVRRY